MSDSVRPHRRQPTRLPHPWDSPGKNTKVGCHFLLQCMKVKSESEVAQSCLTLRDPMDCSLPGSLVQGILQARVLEWVAISFSIPRADVPQTNEINILIVLETKSLKSKCFQKLIPSEFSQGEFLPLPVSGGSRYSTNTLMLHTLIPTFRFMWLFFLCVLD